MRSCLKTLGLVVASLSAMHLALPSIPGMVVKKAPSAEDTVSQFSLWERVCKYCHFSFLTKFQVQFQHHKQMTLYHMKILWSSNASVFNKLYWNIAVGYSCFYTVKAKLTICDRDHKTSKTMAGPIRYL